MSLGFFPLDQTLFRLWYRLVASDSADDDHAITLIFHAEKVPPRSEFVLLIESPCYLALAGHLRCNSFGLSVVGYSHDRLPLSSCSRRPQEFMLLPPPLFVFSPGPFRGPYTPRNRSDIVGLFNP